MTLAATAAHPTRRMSVKSKRLLPRLRRWRRRARWARRRLASAPLIARIAGGVAILLAIAALVNLVYHVIHKPTELFAFIGHRLDKEPAETWRQYGPLFRNLSTSTIAPELLAALAQVETSGNPVDRTYWRWRWSFNPFAIYQPASSAVGLFQMTDGAYAEAARFCIRDHAVVDSGCGFTGLTIRVIPSHAVELASVYLDRNVASVLARAGDVKANHEQKPGSCCVRPSLRCRSCDRFRTPAFSDDGRRALRRSPRRGLCRPDQCAEAAVSAACGRWRELARTAPGVIPG